MSDSLRFLKDLFLTLRIGEGDPSDLRCILAWFYLVVVWQLGSSSSTVNGGKNFATTRHRRCRLHWHNESWTYIETEMQGEMFGRLERRHHVRSINKKLMISFPCVPHSCANVSSRLPRLQFVHTQLRISFRFPTLPYAWSCVLRRMSTWHSMVRWSFSHRS